VTTSAPRGDLFTMRVSKEERKRMEQVAKELALPVSGTIRMLLKREHDQILARRQGKVG